VDYYFSPLAIIKILKFSCGEWRNIVRELAKFSYRNLTP
jgi:hypothetical protein